jgi:hypothetical protein
MNQTYADMLEARQQMYEGVPFAHLRFWNLFEKVREDLRGTTQEERNAYLGMSSSS